MLQTDAESYQVDTFQQVKWRFKHLFMIRLKSCELLQLQNRTYLIIKKLNLFTGRSLYLFLNLSTPILVIWALMKEKF